MNDIVRAAIHPGIGVARVGSSEADFFIGPELPYPSPKQPGFYKDRNGALKRQAAQFRIYGYNAAGDVVRELTADDCDIEWTVHLANKKGSWYQFQGAMDIPGAVPCTRRNAAFTGKQRKLLVIDPGERSIRAGSQQPSRFDTGEFIGRAVYLGELKTDDSGRLLVLGGRGHSDSIYPYNPPNTLGNNDGWYDDTSDGPVSATVTFKKSGKSIPVAPAWVVVGPPNFAPGIISFRNLYDVIIDALQPFWYDVSMPPSFARDILPILLQLSHLQWVNQGFYDHFGWNQRYDFQDPRLLKKLGSKNGIALRKRIFRMFRNPDFATVDDRGWPPLYGEGDILQNPNDPRKFLAVTPTQYRHLTQWADDNFVDDWKGEPEYSNDLDSIGNITERVKLLDEAPLRFCIGGPFHAGWEMTWPMRHMGLYYAPFRIRLRHEKVPEIDYGDELTPKTALSEGGPIFFSGPGDVTRWLGVPWQIDAVACGAGYDFETDPDLPAFWPARMPNHVLSEENYNIAIDTGKSIDERLAAFSTRTPWTRKLKGPLIDQAVQFIRDFGKHGVVEMRIGSEDNKDFPAIMHVESQPGFAQNSGRRNTKDEPDFTGNG